MRVIKYWSSLAITALLTLTGVLLLTVDCEGFDNSFTSTIRINERRHAQVITALNTELLSADELQPHKFGDANSEWEVSMRQMATEALLPVLYPEKIDTNTGAATSTQSLYTSSATYLDEEKALKKLLRQFQKSLSERNTSFEERQASRKRLADLVLGTGMMRIRHWNYYKWKNSKSSNVQPIIGLPCSDFSSTTVHESKVEVVRAMVNLHAEYTNEDFDEHDRIQKMNFDSDAERISIIHSLPLFFVRMMIDQYGSEKAETMAKAFNKSGPIAIRRNEIKCTSDEELCEKLMRENSATAVPFWSERPSNGINISLPEGCLELITNNAWSPSSTSIWSMEAWKDGWFEVQDAGSQLIVKATEASYDDVVIDYCAGNGGKTFALASQMRRAGRNKASDIGGTIISHDIVEERLRQLKGSFSRTGVSAELPITVKTTIDSDVHLEKAMADVVLVDAPCSSTGVLRRRPSQRFKLKEDDITHTFPSLQLNVLNEASDLVKPGGRLIYATCSISKFENEHVVEIFENQPGFSSMWKPWVFDTTDDATIDETSLNLQSHCQQLLPTKDGTDGFFIARWRRSG